MTCRYLISGYIILRISKAITLSLNFLSFSNNDTKIFKGGYHTNHNQNASLRIVRRFCFIANLIVCEIQK